MESLTQKVMNPDDGQARPSSGACNAVTTKYRLMDIREVWKKAYANAEVDWLTFLEAPSYFAKRGSTLMTKADQLAYIERNRRRIVARNTDVELSEELHEVQEHRGWATVAGRATVRRKNEVNRSDFLELWVMIEDRWQIASLCIDELETDEDNSTRT